MKRPTRGRGLLEPLLSRWRARRALRVMRKHGFTKGTEAVVDLGCGHFPLLLSIVKCGRKVGIDRQATDAGDGGVDVIYPDIDACLAGEGEEAFDVATSLAVLEHLEVDEGAKVLGKVFRSLRPGGLVVVTTPSVWGDRVLGTMARLGLVSREEIDEHQHAYGKGELRERLVDAGFTPHTVKVRSFQMGLNQWGMGTKQ